MSSIRKPPPTSKQPPASETGTTFEELVRSLSQPSAFPVPVSRIEVCQTHISAVFLADELVYKVKKPVKLAFLDFSTLPLRRFFCAEEVRVNCVWAPDVYLGVIPVTRESHGLQFDGRGPIVDWAVKMRRLPECATLRSRLQAKQLDTADLVQVARRIAFLHQQAVRCVEEQSRTAETDFRRQLEDNWQFVRGHSTSLVDPSVLLRLERLSKEWLDRGSDTLRRRAEAGFIRELHGDLRLDHVYMVPGTNTGQNILILDAIEFDAALRRIDVMADFGFLVMELSFAGRRDLAQVLIAAYDAEVPAETDRDLWPLFMAYRSAVRGKVAAILSSESEVSDSERERALSRSRAHWLWCLSELEQPGRRPALILVSGLPGTGKSTLARGLAKAVGVDEILRTDVVRRELVDSKFAAVTAENLYSAKFTQAVYDECRERARRTLCAGRRVIVDATFQQEADRMKFLQLALNCGVRAVWLECSAPDDVAKQRLLVRRGDASEADSSVFELAKSRWQPASEESRRFHGMVASGGTISSAVDGACRILREHGLAD